MIDFAHRTFKWSSGAQGAAAVYCVIIGFSPTGTVNGKRLFDYPDVKGQPLETRPKNLNFWLVDSALPGPAKRSTPLLSGLPQLTQGSKPWDGGGLIVAAEDYEQIAADPVAAKCLRPFRQSKELLYSPDRWCLWLKDAAPSNLTHSPVLQARLEQVATARRKSPTASAQAFAGLPARFMQDRQPPVGYLALPEVSSENRDYIPMAFLPADTIAGNKLIIAPDCPLWFFTVLQSAAFTQWVKAFAGRLEADPSINPILTYCVAPFLAPGSKQKHLEEAGQAILDARAAHPDEPLATLYNPLAMPADLRTAHLRADRTVDSLYGLSKPTESTRVAALLRKHHEIAGTALPQLELELEGIA